MQTPGMRAASTHALAQRITVLRVERIHPNPANIRDNLGDLTDIAASIREHGILSPLIVTPHPELPAVYQLLAGHRRLAAAKKAGLDAVPAIIRHGITGDTSLELMLVENCQRRDLNPMEKAEAMAALINRGYSQTEVAKRTGISGSTVSYYLNLIALAPETQAKVRDGGISAADAVAAVRTVRKQDRQKRAGTKTNAYEWEPDIFADTHPLARKARKMCDARDHGMRRRIGKVACGQCWETVIRLDERVVIEAEEAGA
jgi:ParB family chromosome partitioning protein